MNKQYICATCGKLIQTSVCPDGKHHNVFPLEEACDIINAYLSELREQDSDLTDWGWDD